MTYDEQRAAILADLDGKRFREDWHGVSDAANDLRVLEAQHKIREEIDQRDRHDDTLDAFNYTWRALVGSGRVNIGIPFRYQFDNRASPLDPATGSGG